MSKEKLEGRNTNNNVLTSKGVKVFKRRNKVKVLLATTSLAVGIGAGIGVGYGIFHKDTPEPTPILTSLTLSYGSNEYSFTVGSSQSISAPTLKDNNGNNAIATFSCNNLPSWLQLSTQTGAILVEPTVTGDFEITITANGTGEWDKLSTSKNILIKVTDSPIPTPTEISLSYSSDEYTFDNGESSSTGIPTLLDDNYYEVTAEFSYLGTLPNGLEMDDDTGEIFGTPDIDDEQTITVTANGIGEWAGLSSSTNITIKVVSPTPTSITLTYDSVEYQFNRDEISSTGIPVLKDNNNNVALAVFGLHKGTLPTGLFLEPSSGEISGTPTTTQEEEVVIKATGMGKWSGLYCETTITINVVHTNHILLTTGGEVKITDPNGLMVMESMSDDRLNDTTYTNAPIADVSLIKEIHITPNRSITSVGNYYGAYLCKGMNNLVIADINLPESLTTVGNNFCTQMFTDCNSLTSLPDTFNFPQNITSVGNSFANSMFHGCSKLQSLPDDFNLPPLIFGNAGSYFCYSMFRGCSSLGQLPDDFNLPEDITSCEDCFASQMFYECSKITKLPNNFNLPSKISGNVYSDFCYGMFYSCSSLLTLPKDFNIPQGITAEGGYFCSVMFYDCASLDGTGSSGTANFNSPFPTGSSHPLYYAQDMFYGATKLINAGVNDSPTVEQLFAGYNIARNK